MRRWPDVRQHRALVSASTYNAVADAYIRNRRPVTDRLDGRNQNVTQLREAVGMNLGVLFFNSCLLIIAGAAVYWIARSVRLMRSIGRRPPTLTSNANVASREGR
jgi:hypothetical protein